MAEGRTRYRIRLGLARGVRRLAAYGLLAGGVAQLVAALGEPWRLPDALATLVACLGAALLVGEFPVSYAVGDDGLDVRYPLRRLRYRWDDIERIEIGETNAFIHTRRDTVPVTAACERWLDLAEQIAERCDQQRAARDEPVPIDPDDLARWLGIGPGGRLVLTPLRPLVLRWGCAAVPLAMALLMTGAGGIGALITVAAIAAVAWLPFGLQALWRHHRRRITADVNGIHVRTNDGWQDLGWGELRQIEQADRRRWYACYLDSTEMADDWEYRVTTARGTFWFHRLDHGSETLALAIDRALEARAQGYALPSGQQAGGASISRRGPAGAADSERGLSRLDGSETAGPAAQHQDA